MIALLLLLVIIYVVAGIVGFLVHGLFWLFVIAAVLFVGTIAFGALRSVGRRASRRRLIR